MTAALTNPALYAALAGLVTSIASLIKLFHNGAKIDQVQTTTNGTAQALYARIDRLMLTQATPDELAARPPLDTKP